MNIYEMYMSKGMRYGFEVNNERWRKDRTAKVYLIGNTKEGHPLGGKPPYYGNPSVILKAEWMKNGYEIIENGGYRSWNLVEKEPET